MINIKQRLWTKGLIKRQAQPFLILNLLMFLQGFKQMQGKALNGLQASSTPPLHGTREIFLRIYTKVDEAIAAAKAIDGSHYTNYDAVEGGSQCG